MIDFGLNIIGPLGFFVLLFEEIQFLSKFPFHSYVRIFSYKILLVCSLKYSYSCFPSYFCLLVFVLFMFILVFSVLWLAAVISLSLLFLMFSSISSIDAFTFFIILNFYLNFSFYHISLGLSFQRLSRTAGIGENKINYVFAGISLCSLI